MKRSHRSTRTRGVAAVELAAYLPAFLLAVLLLFAGFTLVSNLLESQIASHRVGPEMTATEHPFLPTNPVETGSFIETDFRASPAGESRLFQE